MAKRGDLSVRVLTGSETQNENGTYETDGFSVQRVSCKPFPAVGGGSGLWGRVKRTFRNSANFSAEKTETLRFLRGLRPQPDLLHVFGENYVTATALNYAAARNIPTILELCNEMDSPRQYIPFPDRLWTSDRLPPRLAIVCISERLKRVCERAGYTRNVWCRPNPVDETKFHPISAEEKLATRRRLTKFDDRGKLLVYVAKYIPRKNHVFLVEALARLPEDYRLFLGGPLADSGPLAARDRNVCREVADRAAALGLTDRVQVESGYIENIAEYYRMADAYLFPTKAEGLGTPMLEAMACGTPVVANIIPGITDSWVRDGETGYLSDLDPARFAEKIALAVAFDDARRQAMSRSILAVAGAAAIDARYDQILSALLAAGKGPLGDIV